MRTILTSYDFRGIFEALMTQYNKSIIVNGETTTMTDFLNIDFYTWKDRVDNADTWHDSLTESIDKAYALVEITDCTIVPSQDIDSADTTCRVTFDLQSNKAPVLEQFLSDIRNSVAGVPQDIQNEHGQMLKAFISVGSLLYDSEPEQTQFGEVIQCSCNFSVDYLTEALSYGDMTISFSLDGTTYSAVPLTKGTFQNIFSGQTVPSQARIDKVGQLNSSVSQVKTLAFYDFKNNTFTTTLDDYFWSYGAYSRDGTVLTSSSNDLNLLIYIKVEINGHIYIYKDTIVSMEKVITNGQFNVSSVTLKGRAK